jgi:glycerol-3-phosphate cytidylyltransferase
MFKECKRNCDHFLIFLHEDPTNERPEKCKPILTVSEREEILISLEMVDQVISYKTEDELYELLKKYNPGVRFLGDDYKDKKYTGDDLNIPIHYLDRSHGWSTTKFKKLIAASL